MQLQSSAKKAIISLSPKNTRQPPSPKPTAPAAPAAAAEKSVDTGNYLIQGLSQLIPKRPSGNYADLRQCGSGICAHLLAPL